MALADRPVVITVTVALDVPADWPAERIARRMAEVIADSWKPLLRTIAVNDKGRLDVFDADQLAVS